MLFCKLNRKDKHSEREYRTFDVFYNILVCFANGGIKTKL